MYNLWFHETQRAEIRKRWREGELKWNGKYEWGKVLGKDQQSTYLSLHLFPFPFHPDPYATTPQKKNQRKLDQKSLETWNLQEMLEKSWNYWRKYIYFLILIFLTPYHYHPLFHPHFKNICRSQIIGKYSNNTLTFSVRNWLITFKDWSNFHYLITFRNHLRHSA